MHGTSNGALGSFAAALKDIHDAQAHEQRYMRDQHARYLEQVREAQQVELKSLADKHASQLAAFFEDVQRSTAQIDVEAGALMEKKRQWEMVEQRVHEAVEKLSHSVIKLNVGGRIFAIPKETLLKFEGSYFHAMLSQNNWKPDLDNGITDGTILISEDKRTVSFALSIADESGFIQANRPVDRVSIQLVSRGNTLNDMPLTYIGLEAFQRDGDVDSVVSYNICSGEVSRGHLCEDIPRGQTFVDGDILTIVYNRQDKTIHFAKNGLDMGICLEDVPEKKYYPYVDTNCDGICLSLAS
ncbi:hypothetical protein DYB26_012177 [Aphanomyces astaci]|uniref:SPRY domain-containing protein n=1 Tax=Aphanomyces astaci TaxID=112090 RepID=A0A397EJZ5_APHAT|nr:hypothetical protein DYB34_011606 [Aphanomyces astaci]RHY80594.1 hypothetical protein DYB31_014080 [Aphanomyces astaci]RHZ34436.1 hypothetical protein DYB26_012177 [Aphanomyces astaci]